MPRPYLRSPVRNGFVMIAAAIAVVVLVGSIGLAVDLGRLFLIRTEAQSYIDAVVLDAALEMDGTRQGLYDAAAVPALNTGKWDLGREAFNAVTMEFSPAPEGPWSSAEAAPLNSLYVKARATLNAPLFFIPMVTRRSAAAVPIQAISGQVAKTSYKEGWFPFSPFAHDTGGPHFGLIPTQTYTLRWAANPTLHGHGGGVCTGDRTQAMVDLAQAQGGEERGFYEMSSANLIRQTIINDYMSIERQVGDLINLTGGAKQTQLDAIQARIGQDTDTWSDDYATYMDREAGNGRRLVACPINDGGTPPGTDNRVVGIGSFFLKRNSAYGTGGNQAWCAEYVGSWVQGSRKKGVAPTGSYVVRLVQ
jgi:hypothetical protein